MSAKTKESKKVFTLHYEQEALTDNHSVSGKNWKVIMIHYLLNFGFYVSLVVANVS